jgi:hypothetical protein
LLTAAAPNAAAAAAAAIEQLQEAALQLLLAHCHVPALELSGVLDACLNPAGFKQLRPFLQALLLQQLGPVLIALPVNRAAGALQGLPRLLQEVTAALKQQQQQSASPSSDAALLLVLSTWAGLAQLCQAAADRAQPMLPAHKPLAAALQAAVAGMTRQLPLLPAVLAPGQLAAVVQQSGQQDAAVQLASDVLEQHQQQQQGLGTLNSSSSSSSGGLAAADVLLVWRAALSCLRLLNPDVLLTMTAVQPHTAAAAAGPGASSQQQQQQVPAIQLRSMLVLAGKLSWKELTDAKHALLGMPSAAAAAAEAARGVHSPAQQALLPLALACATAPQAGLLQQLQELPAAAAAAAAVPDNAGLLAAAMITAWQAGQGSSSSSSLLSDAAAGGSAAMAAAAAAAAAVDTQLTGTGPQLLQHLPAVLPQLLSCSRVIGSKQGFTEAVCRVLLDIRVQQGLDPGLGLRLHAAVCAVREQLPSSGSSCWQELLSQAARL